MPKYVLYTGKKKESKFDKLQIELFFLPNISPSNLSCVCIYAQGILTGFYGIRFLPFSWPLKYSWELRVHYIFYLLDGVFRFVPHSFQKATYSKKILKKVRRPLISLPLLTVSNLYLFNVVPTP